MILVGHVCRSAKMLPHPNTSGLRVRSCHGRRQEPVQVFRALQDGVTVVAIKRLHNELDARQRQAFLQEIAMLQDLRSPYIVQFLGACLRPPHSMLVTEWMDESLWHAMARERQQSSQMRWYGR